MTDTQNILKQPKVFQLAILTTLLERFGFYIIVDILVLYTVQQLNFSDYQANTLFSLFMALIYLTPALGGYLADNVIGIRRAIVLGLFFEAVGITLLTIPIQFMLYPALALIAVGVGFFKTGPTNLMARSYATNDQRIDSGFTLFYMCINIGSMISAILAGALQRLYGWHIVFLCPMFGLYLSLLGYFVLRKQAIEHDVYVGHKKIPIFTWIAIILGIIIGVGLCVMLIYSPKTAHLFFYISTGILLLYFLYEIIKSPKIEKFRIIACLCLIAIGMMFFIMLFQLHSSLTLFIDRCVVHDVFGFKIPTLFFVSLDPFWIIVLSPILVSIYKHLGKKNKDFAITTKFTLGLLMATLSFLFLKFSINFADNNYQVPAILFTIAIAIFALGELLISALGVAMVARIAPKRMYGVMMGAWFLIASSLGSALGGKVASLASIPKTLHDPAIILNIYGKIYWQIGIAGLIITIIALIASPYIKRFANLNT